MLWYHNIYSTIRHRDRGRCVCCTSHHNYTGLAGSSGEAVFVHIACCGVTTFTQQVGTETEGGLAESSREAVFVHIACYVITTFTQSRHRDRGRCVCCTSRHNYTGLADSSREAVFVHIACCGITTFTQQVGTETEGGACVVPVATITQT
ncbi:hypothetical protein J6590_065091 [Homalodisca vitripennis]|nr:hypothetical protein J6590_065091 [Homalodisca vitripennis]